MDNTTQTLLAGASEPAARTPAAAAFDQMAATMYSAPTPPPVDAAPNAEVAALRNKDATARALYAPQDQYGSAVHELALAVNPQGSAADLATQKAALGAVVADVGMGHDDVMRLASFAKGYAAAPPTEEMVAANRRATVDALRAQYGDRYDSVMADAQKLVKRDPRLFDFLGRTGLASHPWVVQRVVELAQSQRGRGRLV